MAQEGPFLREKRLNNGRRRGLSKVNAGHAPQGMVSRGPEALLRRYSRGVTPLARALPPEKGASKIYIAISYSGQNVWLFRKIPCATIPCDLYCARTPAWHAHVVRVRYFKITQTASLVRTCTRTDARDR
jgi:hypothetical protein